MINIACIIPIKKDDYLTNTVIDGLSQLENEGDVSYFVSSNLYKNENIKSKNIKIDDDFIEYAKNADIIMLFWSKDGTDINTANKINRYDKTIFIDGGELGGNKRLDREIVDKINNLKWENQGKIDIEMLQKCAGYFRREKPYIKNIIPFPFGIERKYINWNKDIKKDIDFVCIFGQQDYPPLRKQVKEILEDFCKKNNFSCFTQKTKTKEEFYDVLSRSKVGISVSGGGYDTARFWEILANDCILLTEKIDIYKPEENRLSYSNIYEFNNKNDFLDLLNNISEYLINDYDIDRITSEYNKIIDKHSTKSRAQEIIDYCKYKGIIK